MIRNLSQYINLLVLVVVVAILAKLVVILKVRLRSISKKITTHIFKYLHFTATFFDSYSSLCFKIIDKAHSKFDSKIREALHINWGKPNLNAQQNNLAFTLSLQFLSPCSFLSLFVLLLLLFFFEIFFHLLFSLSRR